MERVKDTRAPFYRPPFPHEESTGVHPGILTLMKQCWAEEPSDRPSFNEIDKTLLTINKGKSVLFDCFTEITVAFSTLFLLCAYRCAMNVCLKDYMQKKVFIRISTGAPAGFKNVTHNRWGAERA